jgi:hypothetical protein
MRYTPLIVVPLLAFALGGCAAVQQEPPAATVAVEEQPLFASEEEALAAAQAAYTQYLAVSDQIARDGGANPERLEGLVSKALFEESKRVFQSFEENLTIVTGSTNFDSLHFSALEKQSSAFYVCLNVGQTQLLNNEGIDVTPAARQSRLPILFSLAKKDNHVIIESSEVWSGRNFC